MGGRNGAEIHSNKSERAIDREINTALFLLRALQCGVSIADMEYLTIGMINDMFIEWKNDECEYDYIATQQDIDRL